MTTLSAKRRVLFVTSNFPRWPGDSTTPFVLHLAQDLIKIGWEVDVLAPHAPGTKKNEIINGVSVERFQYLWPEILQTVCYQGGALINLRKNKGNLFKLPALVAFELLNIYLKLKKGHYDLLHSHWILPQGFTGVLATKVQPIPHLITVHGGDVFALKGKVLNTFKQFSLSHCNAITVNSSATQTAVQELCPDLKHLHKIPMGVEITNNQENSHQLALKAQYKKNAGPLLIFVGRLVDEKGVEDFIRAIGLVKTKLPELSALIIGQGQDREAFERLTKSLNLDQIITFTGWIDPEKIQDYLSIADIFIGPSRISESGWKEAQGLTFLEAMAANTPVIATRTGGITDFIIDGETGLLVKERCPEEIAVAIEKIILQPDLMGKLQENAYLKVIHEYSREISANNFSNLYGKLLL
ncbi:Glycosyltransferase family 4 protein [Candidatus Methylobacter favarea]|uniref:Glycosyltransferase family 4 protein n=1 Tax=Candidatus Methylobacter favarea TaxID=2707345 RepID=A0A8S0X2N4_9GAMM|nr:glycosyltransferase family 4 protein [Candidatus Methylobacter favarea]CAA9892064.1 Glycosyltransferase family 4 protein [Candidatus Methylobacter favarea]